MWREKQVHDNYRLSSFQKILVTCMLNFNPGGRAGLDCEYFLQHNIPDRVVSTPGASEWAGPERWRSPWFQIYSGWIHLHWWIPLCSGWRTWLWLALPSTRVSFRVQISWRMCSWTLHSPDSLHQTWKFSLVDRYQRYTKSYFLSNW